MVHSASSLSLITDNIVRPLSGSARVALRPNTSFDWLTCSDAPSCDANCRVLALLVILSVLTNCKTLPLACQSIYRTKPRRCCRCNCHGHEITTCHLNKRQQTYILQLLNQAMNGIIWQSGEAPVAHYSFPLMDNQLPAPVEAADIP